MKSYVSALNLIVHVTETKTKSFKPFDTCSVMVAFVAAGGGDEDCAMRHFNHSKLVYSRKQQPYFKAE